jgi:glycosyltransferase involved in cell wall biosynthesis
MKFGIVVPTYKRSNGTTPSYLKRTLNSVFKQTYDDFKIFLIGDKYEDLEEIDNIIKQYPQNKILFYNLPYAKERDLYLNINKMALWNYGGVNANNTGIEASLKENIYHICHLDHDDYWLPDHLELIKNCINETNSDFICTKCKYLNRYYFPEIENGQKYIPWLPVPGKLIHSSTCINFKTIPLRYRDIYAETGTIGMPADADLWHRISQYIKHNNLKSHCVNALTCHHDEEGYELNK